MFYIDFFKCQFGFRYLENELDFAPFYTGMFVLQRLMTMPDPGDEGRDMISYISGLAATRYAEVGLGNWISIIYPCIVISRQSRAYCT